jgi:hypothetical protein
MSPDVAKENQTWENVHVINFKKSKNILDSNNNLHIMCN